MDGISGTVVGRFTGHTDWVSEIAVNEVRGDVFATGSSDSSVRVWRIGEEWPLAILTDATGRVNSVGWSEDGRRLVSGSDDERVRVYEERRGVAEWQLGWTIVIGSIVCDEGRRRGSSGRGSVCCESDHGSGERE